MLSITAKRYPFEPIGEPKEESATSENQGSFFEQLPAELKVRILTFLDLPDLGSCCLTSKELNQLVSVNKIWKGIAKRINFVISGFSKGPPLFKQILDFIGRKWRRITEINNRPMSITQILKGPSIDQINSIQNWLKARDIYFDWCRLAVNMNLDFPLIEFEASFKFLGLEGFREIDKFNEQEIVSLCCEWKERNESFLKARDILIVWQSLAAHIKREVPIFPELSSIEAVIRQSEEFDAWFEQNERLLVRLNGLSLTSKLLTTIPPQIYRLSGLKSLALDNNLLTSFPLEIDQFPRLESLYLFSNLLSSIPNEIGELPMLGWLSIHDNPLTSIPQSVIMRVQCGKLQKGKLKSLGVPSSLLKRRVRDAQE